MWATLKTMSNQQLKFDPAERRAAVRRTVWIMAGVALAIFVLFFVKQGIWH
jgi:type VI protein secretion system component VasF